MRSASRGAWGDRIPRSGSLLRSGGRFWLDPRRRACNAEARTHHGRVGARGERVGAWSGFSVVGDGRAFDGDEPVRASCGGRKRRRWQTGGRAGLVQNRRALHGRMIHQESGIRDTRAIRAQFLERGCRDGTSPLVARRVGGASGATRGSAIAQPKRPCCRVMSVPRTSSQPSARSWSILPACLLPTRSSACEASPSVCQDCSP